MSILDGSAGECRKRREYIMNPAKSRRYIEPSGRRDNLLDDALKIFSHAGLIYERPTD